MDTIAEEQGWELTEKEDELEKFNQPDKRMPHGKHKGKSYGEIMRDFPEYASELNESWTCLAGSRNVRST